MGKPEPFAQIPIDKTKSEAEQIAAVMKELESRGMKPNRAAVAKVVRSTTK